MSNAFKQTREHLFNPLRDCGQNIFDKLVSSTNHFFLNIGVAKRIEFGNETKDFQDLSRITIPPSEFGKVHRDSNMRMEQKKLS